MEWISWFVESYVQRNKELLIVIAAVLFVRFLMKKMPKKYAYCLWAIVGIRMLFSFQVSSPVSIYQFFPWAQASAENQFVAGESGLGLEQVLAGKSDLEQKQVLAEESGLEQEQADKNGISESELEGINGKLFAEGGQPERESADVDPTGLPIGGAWSESERDQKAISESAEDAARQNAYENEALKEKVREVRDGDRQTVYAADSSLMGRGEGSEGREELETKGYAHGIFFGTWLIGMVTILGIGLYSYSRVKKLVREAVLENGNLWECDGISTPFVLGILRPQIYVPFHLDDERKKLVLEHEGQHVRRGDPFVRLLAYALLAVYWMNPLVWLSYFCFVRDQEMSCDEAVLSRLGSEWKRDYGRTLLSFATNERFLGFTPVGFGESDAEKRIRNVLNYKKPSFWILILGILILIGMGVICLTTAKNKTNTQEGRQLSTDPGQEGSEMSEGEKKSSEYVYEDKVWQFSADLDGDGETEEVWVIDHAKSTTLKAELKDKNIAEITFPGVDLVHTQGEVADLDGDGKDEIILLQSSPLGSTYNWPGSLFIYQLENGEWEQMTDQLIYDAAGELRYQGGYPQTLSDGMFVNVRIEQNFKSVSMQLVRPYRASEAMVAIECTYDSYENKGWKVGRIDVYENYFQDKLALGTISWGSITNGNLPVRTSGSVQDLSQNLFTQLPKEFLFASGAGGWGTMLSVKEDGSFSGRYADGDAGAGDYDWKTYVCEFSGRLSSPEKRNELAYVCHVEELTYPEVGQTRAEGKTLYETTTPYGLDDVDEIVIYLPGYPVSELPYEVLSWISGSADRYFQYEKPDVLGFYVLYNVRGGQAFTSSTLKEFQGMRMNVKTDFEGKTYPAWMVGDEAHFNFEVAVGLCTDAAANFVQKVAKKNGLPVWYAGEMDFSPFVRNERLLKYLDYKVSQYPHLLRTEWQWYLDLNLDEIEYLHDGDETILHLKGIPKYKSSPGEGSCGEIHFLIGLENGEHVIRDWYLEAMDSVDVKLRGRYSAEDFMDYWENPEKYGAIMDDDGKLK